MAQFEIARSEEPASHLRCATNVCVFDELTIREQTDRFVRRFAHG